jgi:Fe-S cluster biogenesis protein NfuA
MQTQPAPELQGHVARIEESIHALERIADPAIRAQTRELVQTLLEWHGSGLERLLEITHARGEAGAAIIDALGADPIVSPLLLLHGLHPLDLETRVRAALEKVRPRLALHSGSVELLEVTPEGGVRLRLEGNCHGCPSSRLTLHSTIEQALEAAAPDVAFLEVDGVTESEGAASKFTTCPTQAVPA